MDKKITITGGMRDVIPLSDFLSNREGPLMLLERSPEAMCIVQVQLDDVGAPNDLILAYVNDAFRNLYGLMDMAVENKSVYEILPLMGKQWLQEFSMSAYHNDYAKVRFFSRQLGSYMSMKRFQVAFGYCGCIFKNFSERREEKLLSIRNKRRLDVILNNSTDVVFDFNLAKRMLQCGDLEGNEAKFSISNVPAALVEKKMIHSTGAAAIEEMLRQIQLGVENVSCELEISHEGEGQFLWYRCTALAYKEEDTGKLCIVGYLKNIHLSVLQRRELQKQADCDQLTGIYNAGAGRKLIKNYLQDPVFQTQPCTMFMFDLDNFKSINDEYGHIAGDTALQDFAYILKTVFRKDDVVFRLGGDEFVAFAPCAQTKGFIERICQEVQTRMNALQSINSGFSTSIGVAVCAQAGTATYERLYRTADEALYCVKRASKKSHYTIDL